MIQPFDHTIRHYELRISFWARTVSLLRSVAGQWKELKLCFHYIAINWVSLLSFETIRQKASQSV